MFKHDYQFMIVLEEAIHWSQLKHSDRRKITRGDEVESKEKLLKIADFLGFDKQRKEFLQQSRNHAIASLEDIQNSQQNK